MLTIADLVAIRPALEKLVEEQYPFETAFKLATFAREVMEEIQKFEAKRLEYFRKYGEELEEGNLQIPPKNEAKFKNAITRSLNVKAKVKPLKAEDLRAVVKPADLINCLKAFE